MRRRGTWAWESDLPNRLAPRPRSAVGTGTVDTGTHGPVDPGSGATDSRRPDWDIERRRSWIEGLRRLGGIGGGSSVLAPRDGGTTRRGRRGGRRSRELAPRAG